MDDQACPVCGQQEPLVFFKAASVPVFCNVLWSNPEKAKQARAASIRLGLCKNCTFIYNLDFDEALIGYNPNYENSLNFSGRFQAYATQLAKELIERYQIFGQQIIEIGCGQADFLSLLCLLGDNHGTGFDPSYDSRKSEHIINSNIKIIPELYSENSIDTPVDFICCRHVLEHIKNPVQFLHTIRLAIGNRKEVVVFLEVPNALYTIKDQGIWDIIYEHCCYFLSCSLKNAFKKAGFKPLRTSVGYEGQFLRIEAVPETSENQDTIESDEYNLLSLVENFGDSYKTKVQFWKKTLSNINHQRAVLWGAGSKGVTFLNTLRVSNDNIKYVVDLNPRKWGRFIPGTAQQVVRPELLKEYDPEIVIVMNPVYRKEIENMLQDLGIRAKVLVV